MLLVQRALALRATAHRNLVHDVVVVQGGQVDHLDDRRRVINVPASSGRG